MADPELIAALKRSDDKTADLEKQVQVLAAERDALKREKNGQATTAAKNYEAQTAELKREIERLTREVQNASTELHDAHQSEEHWKTENGQLRADVKKARAEEHAKLVKANQTHVADATAKDEQIKRLKADLENRAVLTKTGADNSEAALAAKENELTKLRAVNASLHSINVDLQEGKTTLAARLETEEAKRRSVQVKLDKAVSENADAEARVRESVQSQVENLRKLLQDAQAARILADELRSKQERAHQVTNQDHDKQLRSLRAQVDNLDRNLKGAQNQLEVEREKTRAAQLETDKVRQSQAEYVEGLNKRWTAAQSEKQGALATTDGLRRHVSSLLADISRLKEELKNAQDLASRSVAGSMSIDTDKIARTEKDLARKVQEVRDLQAELSEFKRNAIETDKKRMETIATERKEKADALAALADTERRLAMLESERALA